MTAPDLNARPNSRPHAAARLDPRQDVALLAARFDGIPPQNVAYWFLEPHPQTASRARRLVRRALRRWHLPELIDATELLVSEVVTNAVRHASSAPRIEAHLGPDSVRVAVYDADPRLPERREPDVGRPGGRGLHLLDQIASRWAAEPSGSGKVVWFELDRPAGGASPTG